MSGPRIVCWPRLSLGREETLAALRGMPGLDLGVVQTLPDLLGQLPGADGLVLHSAPLAQARAVVEALPSAGGRLRWMHFLTAGRDAFEAAGLPRTMTVTHVPGASAATVAEHALALLLALCRRLPTAVEFAARRRWERGEMGVFATLEGMRVAVIGTGAIGCEMARRLWGFGAIPIGVSRSGVAQSEFEETGPVSDLHALLATCQAVLVAVPLSPATRHLIDAKALAALPTGAYVVNVARGAVVEQVALCDALESGRLGGAGLDVTDPEPPAPDDRIWSCPNVLVTPHVAVEGSAATARRLAAGTAENVRRFAAGEALLGRAQR